MSAVAAATTTLGRLSVYGFLWSLCPAARSSKCCPHSLVSCDTFIHRQPPAGPADHRARPAPAPPPLHTASAPPVVAPRTCGLPSPPPHPSSRSIPTWQRACRCFRRSASLRPSLLGRLPHTALPWPVSSNIADNCATMISMSRTFWKSGCATRAQHERPRLLA